MQLFIIFNLLPCTMRTALLPSLHALPFLLHLRPPLPRLPPPPSAASITSSGTAGSRHHHSRSVSSTTSPSLPVVHDLRRPHHHCSPCLLLLTFLACTIHQPNPIAYAPLPPAATMAFSGEDFIWWQLIQIRFRQKKFSNYAIIYNNSNHSRFHKMEGLQYKRMGI